MKAFMRLIYREKPQLIENFHEFTFAFFPHKPNQGND